MTTTIVTELRSGSWEVVAERTTASFTVRNLGLIRVRGTITVDEGTVTVEDGQPVQARATLDAGSVSTGIRKRDADLAGRRFFATARHPSIHVVVDDVRPTPTPTAGRLPRRSPWPVGTHRSNSACVARPIQAPAPSAYSPLASSTCPAPRSAPLAG